MLWTPFSVDSHGKSTYKETNKPYLLPFKMALKSAALRSPEVLVTNAGNLGFINYSRWF